MKYTKFLIIIFFFNNTLSQQLYESRTKAISPANSYLQDTLKKKAIIKENISAIFLGIGGGLSIPLSPFSNNSNAAFGILGRLEFSSTYIFPFVIGGEVTYFSYNGDDLFKTTNTLANFDTKILAYGLNIEYSLSKFLPSAFTIPFISVDVKYNSIERVYDENKSFPDLSREESGISVGAGIGFTLFIFDFHIKYNFLKNSPNIGIYVKTKFPVIRL